MDVQGDGKASSVVKEEAVEQAAFAGPGGDQLLATQGKASFEKPKIGKRTGVKKWKVTFVVSKRFRSKMFRAKKKISIKRERKATANAALSKDLSSAFNKCLSLNETDTIGQAAAAGPAGAHLPAAQGSASSEDMEINLSGELDMWKATGAIPKRLGLQYYGDKEKENKQKENEARRASLIGASAPLPRNAIPEVAPVGAGNNTQRSASRVIVQEFESGLLYLVKIKGLRSLSFKNHEITFMIAERTEEFFMWCWRDQDEILVKFATVDAAKNFLFQELPEGLVCVTPSVYSIIRAGMSAFY